MFLDRQIDRNWQNKFKPARNSSVKTIRKAAGGQQIVKQQRVNCCHAPSSNARKHQRHIFHLDSFSYWFDGKYTIAPTFIWQPIMPSVLTFIPIFVGCFCLTVRGLLPLQICGINFYFWIYFPHYYAAIELDNHKWQQGEHGVASDVDGLVSSCRYFYATITPNLMPKQ